MSTVNDADSSTTRLDVLERQTKRLRKESLALKIVLLVVAAILLVSEVADFFIDKRLGIVTDGLVQTPRLVIVDDAGERRAELGTSAGGVPHLTLFDASARPRFVATQFDDRVRLRMTDRDQRRIELQLVDGGEQTLALTGKEGNTKVVLGESRGGDLCLQLFGPAEQLRVVLGACKAGDSGLQLFGPAEQPRVTLTACKAGDSGLLLFDQAEVVRLLAGVGDDGNSLLNIFDESGQARVRLGQSLEGWPALDMLASDGTARATLHAPDEWACLTLRGPRGEATAKTWVDELGLARAIFCDPDGDLTWSVPPEWYLSLKRRFLEKSEAQENSADATEP